ncbi:hypothetical protein KKC1_09040 [Calderihabitans maritimus]|uniref:Uncharacterized protein n=1 Tax=Calderihabitans maritimus TaxID=1246530 RepID=A0A1Z5HQD2_9FIRM|nr:hypothetical protein KKC1_09040 [Calderihabitans maritimus]
MIVACNTDSRSFCKYGVVGNPEEVIYQIHASGIIINNNNLKQHSA